MYGALGAGHIYLSAVVKLLHKHKFIQSEAEICLFRRRIQNHIIILCVNMDEFTVISTSKTLQNIRSHTQNDLQHQAARRTRATPRMDEKYSPAEICTHTNPTPYNMLPKRLKWTCRTGNQIHTTLKRHSMDELRQTNRCQKPQNSTSNYSETSTTSRTLPDLTSTMLPTDYTWQPKHLQQDIR